MLHVTTLPCRTGQTVRSARQCQLHDLAVRIYLRYCGWIPVLSCRTDCTFFNGGVCPDMGFKVTGAAKALVSARLLPLFFLAKKRLTAHDLREPNVR